MCLDNIFFLNVVFLLGRLKKYNKIIFLQKSRVTQKLNIDTKVIICVRNFNSNLYNNEWLTVYYYYYYWMIRCIQFWLWKHIFITVPSICLYCNVLIHCLLLTLYKSAPHATGVNPDITLWAASGLPVGHHWLKSIAKKCNKCNIPVN